jgi:putative colanic acid biosynthesis UDP-glucose lipid carrier transferase
VDGVVKRLFDLVVGGLILACVAIPMAVIALAIKLSRGPVFPAASLRTGRQEILVRFRSMRVLENGAKVTQATQGDPHHPSAPSFAKPRSTSCRSSSTCWKGRCPSSDPGRMPPLITSSTAL